jgi:protein involved in polysaccharide export with SLBB domain
MKRVTLSICLILLIILPACAPAVKNPTPIDHPAFQATPQTPDSEYRIEVGDQLDVKFFYYPELNEQVTVRPDGRISLQLVREIMVAGLTPAELTEQLVKKYAVQIKKPEIAVLVRSFSGRSVFVDGEVNRPGMIPVIKPITLLQSIAQAGGVKETALTEETIVIRRGADHKPLVLSVNLKKAVDGTDPRQDIALRPFDIVFVPRSPITNVNVWIDQYIRKNIPVPFAFGWSFD